MYSRLTEGQTPPSCFSRRKSATCCTVALTESIFLALHQSVNNYFANNFRKVYWSPRSVCVSVCLSVCLSVCYFAKVFDFSQSILVSTVCLFACLSVCLSVTPPTGHSLAPIKIIFFIVDSAYPANVTFFFL